MAQDCPHKPPCPEKATRFACGQRTSTEDAVKRGWIERAMAERLLHKFGTIMTPASKVQRGDAKPDVLQTELFHPGEP